MSELTLVSSNSRRVRRLRFALQVCNRDTGHYLTYKLCTGQGVQHWFLLKRNSPNNSFAIKEMGGFYRPSHLTPPA